MNNTFSWLGLLLCLLVFTSCKDRHSTFTLEKVVESVAETETAAGCGIADRYGSFDLKHVFLSLDAGGDETAVQLEDFAAASSAEKGLTVQSMESISAKNSSRWLAAVS